MNTKLVDWCRGERQEWVKSPSMLISESFAILVVASNDTSRLIPLETLTQHLDAFQTMDPSGPETSYRSCVAKVVCNNLIDCLACFFVILTCGEATSCICIFALGT